MDFAVSPCSPDAARILALDGDGTRPMQLVAGNMPGFAGPGDAAILQQARAALKHFTPHTLFPHARSPEGAMAGIHLYFACEEEAHTLAQHLNTAEGSFWHGILHRQEPDAANAAYWFRQVGQHAIFPALRHAALLNGFACGETWDPMEFIAFCDSARTRPGSPEERLAMQVQLCEWQLLFNFCATEKTA